MEVSTQVNEFGIELAKAKTIESVFDVINAEKQGLYVVYKNIITQEITPDLVKQARELRLKLVKIRTNIASIHKNEKAFYLASGKYIDALKNKLTEPVEIAEEKLSELENYYINIEKQAKEQRTISRLERVSKFKNDVQASQIADLEDETFEMLLTGYETAFNADKEAEEKARLEAEKAPTKEKLTAWVNEFSIYAPFGESDNTLVVDIIAKHKAFKAWAIKEIEKL